MHISKAVLSVASVVTLGAAMVLPTVRAGETDQLTKFQFNFAKPIEVPGQVLQPGTYWFMIQDGQEARNDQEKNVISIYNADKTHLIANVPARPVQRKDVGYDASRDTKAMDGVELHIAPGGPSRPATLVSWFYPSTVTGHQFVYPEREQKRLDEEPKQTVVLQVQKGEGGTFSASFDQ